MIHFYVYDTGNGRVLATASYDERGDGANARAIGSGQINAQTEYAPGGVKTARPVASPVVALDKSSVVANAADVATVSNIPNPSNVAIFRLGEQFPRAVARITDGVAALTFDKPGTYAVHVRSFPTQDTLVTIEATV